MAVFRRSLINRISSRIIAAAIEVHRHLGPGLLERVYKRCMHRELRDSGLSVEFERAMDITYKGETLDSGFRIDLIVEGLVVVELKAVDEISPVHEAQLLTYLKLTGAPLGLLINFNVPVLHKGVKRMLNKAHEIVDEFNPIEKRRLAADD